VRTAALNDRVVLLEAAGEMRRGERFEQVLGRVARRHGGTYADYVRLIGRVREVAGRKKLTLAQAARAVAYGLPAD